jgi:hypothetical protein
MEWNHITQGVYYIAGTIGVLGTLVAACSAALVYRRNSELERAKWALTLYEKFYEKEDLKIIRNELDCSEPDPEVVRRLVKDEGSNLTDYLNFFEFIAFLQKSKQLNSGQVEDLFGFYLDCLERHTVVKGYILKLANGYEGLASLLSSRSASKQLRQ